MKVLMWEHFAPGGAIRVGGHHFAERFLRDGCDVAWCAGPISPFNWLKGNDETAARMTLWRRGGERRHQGKMFAYAPMTWLPWRRRPLFDSRFVATATLRATTPRLTRVLRDNGFGQVDLLFMEPGAPLLALLDEVPHRVSVYRMCDETAAFSDTPRSFAAMEREVVGRVDLVVATARRLEQRAREWGARKVLYLPNACDPEPFAAPTGGVPEDISALPRPRALYAGAIDSWFDAALVADCARRLPGWRFVLIGPIRRPLPILESLPNVHLLGPRPYAVLPRYFAAADAGIVPFELSAMTRSIHPIKVYEYCAAGLPVVATPMDETVAMGAPLLLADGGEAFAAALESLGHGASPRARETRLSYARHNTWDMRYAELCRALGIKKTARPAPATSAPPRSAAGGGR